MSNQLYRVRSDGAGGCDEVVRAASPQDAARIFFEVVEERGASAEFAHVVLLEPPEEDYCGHVYKTTEETVIRWPDHPAAGKPFDYWPWVYESQARAEGWILTNDSLDRTTISRIDNPTEAEPRLDYDTPRFTDDSAAQSFVIERALAGRRLHLLAIYLTGVPVEQPLDMPVPRILRLARCPHETLPDDARS